MSCVISYNYAGYATKGSKVNLEPVCCEASGQIDVVSTGALAQSIPGISQRGDGCEYKRRYYSTMPHTMLHRSIVRRESKRRRLAAQAVASRARDRISKPTMIVMLSAFQARPFIKAAA
jgi:hypothetical protein